MAEFHTIPPVFDRNSRVLVLGSFPSVKSREQGFFYGHPQNRFWKVMSGVFGCGLPQSIDEKKAMLLETGVALWDVIGRCDITGSSDSTIKNAVPNDLRVILDECDIRAIYTNGRTAQKYFDRFARPLFGRSAVCLPSTSPANAAWTLDRLIESWRILRSSFDE